jgi:hypothetical protein
VVTDDDYVAYQSKIQERVGWMKSGWLKGLEQCNDTNSRIQNFITRHGTKFGRAQSSFSNLEKPSIEAANFAPSIRVTQHIVDTAVRTRQFALARRYKRLLAGIKDDVTAGRRVSKVQHINP